MYLLLLFYVDQYFTYFARVSALPYVCNRPIS